MRTTDNIDKDQNANLIKIIAKIFINFEQISISFYFVGNL